MTSSRSGQIVTFYSYKGGTGRSMALANVAWILASSGKKILVIDWDLEAPGLHRYFRPFLTDPDLLETSGLIDTFWTFAANQLAASASDDKSVSQDPAVVTAGLLDATRRLHRKKLPITPDSRSDLFTNLGSIDFIGAGRQTGTYSERVNTFDWHGFYKLGGADVLSVAATEMRRRYDWILIDSRTGVSDTAGISTMELPDIVVACFTMNRQSIDGVASVLSSIKAFRSKTRPEDKIRIFPVAMRIENAEKERLDRARGYARERLKEFLPAEVPDPLIYWSRMEVAYRPYYAYQEVLAPFGDETGSSASTDSLLAMMEGIAQTLADPQGKSSPQQVYRAPEIAPVDRLAVLDLCDFKIKPHQFSLNSTTASRNNSHQSESAFIRSVYEKEQIWKQNAFDYRWLLSARELHILSSEELSNFGRTMSYYFEQSGKADIYLTKTDRISLLTYLLAVAMAGFYLFIEYFITNVHNQSNTYLLQYLFGNFFNLLPAMVASCVIPFILSFFLLRFDTGIPYGVRTSHVIKLIIMGPLRPPVIDYG